MGMLIHEYSHLHFVQPVDVVEDGRSITATELLTRYGNRPVLLKRTAVEASEADWSEVFEALAEMKCVIATQLEFEGRTYVFKGGVILRDFLREVEKRDGIYLAEWYLFQHAPELMEQLTTELPDALLDDWLNILPQSWGLVSTPTRTNLYYGSHGSRTQIHIDAMNATTWNMCLRGTKRWLLFSCQDSRSSLVGGGPKGQRALQSFSKHGDPWDFITADALAKYHEAESRSGRQDELPTFFTVDVQAGSTLWVPWGWAHQVQNIGVSLAVSRYYVGPSNFPAFIRESKTQLGRLSPPLLRVLLGGPRRRALLKMPAVHQFLSHRISSRVVRGVLRLGNVISADNHWFRRFPK